MTDPRGTKEEMNLGNLPMVWSAVDRLNQDVEQLHRQHPTWSQELTARFIDENQTAGRRTYINAARHLQVAYDNHLALIALLRHHGATHWAPWNLMRPIFETSFYALWILDPSDSRERRRRGLRVELNDAQEKKKWVESLAAAGVGDDALAPLRKRREEVTKIYRAESDELGLRWQASRAINLVDEIPKLRSLVDTFDKEGAALFVSTWRRLSGFQHAMSYALQAGAEVGPAIKIPGGEVIHFTINDEDFVSTAQQTHAMHVTALNLYKLRTLAGP